MQLVEIHQISRGHPFFKECDSLSRQAKLLYNEANYLVRQLYISKNDYLDASNLQKLLQKTSENYKSLPAKVSAQTLRNLHTNWLSFFAAMREYGKHPSKFLARPSLPGYKKVYCLVIYDRQAISTRELKKGMLKLSKTNIKIPYQHKECQVKQARIIPINSQLFKIEIVYEIKNKEVEQFGTKQVGVDLGLNNLATIAGEANPVIMEGRVLKSYNQYYNKERARLQAKLPQGQYSSKRIDRLTNKRNNKINDYMHRISKRIIDYCLTNAIGELVIGYNPEWKQKINLGRRTNQNFVNIPFRKLIEKVQYKAEREGIEVILQEESYTSKCSFLDDEPMCHHEKYVGRRIRRGLFRSEKGVVINADVNGALNILRKSNPQFNVVNEGIQVVAIPPVRVNPHLKGKMDHLQTEAMIYH